MMRTVETTWREFGRFPLQLGRMAENDVLRIAVDVSGCLRLYPAATFGVNVENAAGVKYPAENVKLDNGLVLWAITAADTAVAGDGKAQVVMYGESGEIDRSAQVQTVVLPSILPDANPPGVPPNWLDVANRLQGQIDKLAESDGIGAFPAEDVGKLLYIGEDGMAHALALGDGLSIVDGVLHVEGVEATDQTFYTADGSVFYTIDDALFKVKGE